MSVLIFKLNGVDDEEAEDVRELFDNHGIEFYETDAGRWGISVAALWLIDKQQLAQAKHLLAEYQQLRSQQRQSLPSQSFSSRLKQAPLHYLIIIAAIAAILYISIAPFIAIN
ncbi:MAG TPA: hypothetical protein ENI05_01030 [Porticoccus sp.]|nr:hypothetical protein [Porticoccus sp.]